MANLAAKLPAGTKVINPSTGSVSIVKWASKTHVQFEGGHSCSVKSFPMFYRDCDIVRPGECKPWISGDDRTAIVNNR
jgi:hypothetical protein